MDFCQHRATSGGGKGDITPSPDDLKMSDCLAGVSSSGFSDADLSLLSWLQAVPRDAFSCPFEQRTLNVDVQSLDKPSLEVSWTEQLLITPIKPKVL